MALELNPNKVIPVPASAVKAGQTNAAAEAQVQVAHQEKAAEARAERAEVSREQVEFAVSKLSEYAQSVNRSLNFSVDDNLGRTVITVTDRETDEVVRQIPSEEFVELAEDLRSLQGQLLRTSA